MSVLYPQIAVWARRPQRPLTILCVALLLLTSPARAGTILQFSQINAVDSITATESGGVTTLSTAGYVDGGFVSIPVILSNFNGQTEPPGTMCSRRSRT